MAIHEDSDNQLAMARNVYHRIRQGRHPEPDAGFELIRALLHDAGYPEQFHRLDEMLPEDAKIAENHIQTKVIPRSYLLLTLRKFQAYQDTEGKESEIQRGIRRDELETLFRHSKHHSRYTHFPALEGELSRLCQEYSKDLSAEDTSLSSAAQHADGFLESLTSGIPWAEKVSQQPGFIAEINYRNTVTVDIVLQAGAVNGPRSLETYKKRLERIVRRSGIESFDAVAVFKSNPDRVEQQVITLTVGPSVREKLELIVQAFEKETKGRDL